MTHKQHFNLYISSCKSDGGIYLCSFEDDRLSIVSKTELDRPMYTITDGNKLYALLRAPFSDSDSSGILSFEISENGELTQKSDIMPTNGVIGCHLCRAFDSLYAANYISGSVTKLGEKTVTHIGGSVHPTRQEAAHTHFISLTPDGKYLFAIDLGGDIIKVYDKDLNEVSHVNAPKGSGPRHIAFSEDGKYAYCSDELSSSVSVYKYSDGVFSYICSKAALPCDFNGENTSAAIRFYDGYVYVSNRGHDSVSCFKADGDNLTLESITPCCGKSPRDMNIKDNILICTNEADDTVTVFEIISHTKLNHIQTISVPAPLCVTFA